MRVLKQRKQSELFIQQLLEQVPVGPLLELRLADRLDSNRSTGLLQGSGVDGTERSRPKNLLELIEIPNVVNFLEGFEA